jgi:MSHA biogenesis protein MshL
VRSGEVAVLGGLMQDTLKKSTSGIPFLSKIPWIGRLFSLQDEELVKTELIIFLRPIVIKDASLNGDLSPYRPFLKKTNLDKINP